MKENGLYIAVFHCLGEKSNWFSGIADVELIFPKYDEYNKYLVHDCTIPFPNFLKEFPFDGILLTSTFLDWMKNCDQKSKWAKQFEFLKHSKAIKIAFPQDDYWLSENRDQFYVANNIDLVLPVCSEDTWDELIPKTILNKINVKQGYTTYVTPQLLEISKFNKDWDSRKLDVVYRASGEPTFPNELGVIKANLGEVFKKSLNNFIDNIKFDLSTSSNSLIKGNDWYDFVGNSRAILGSNSGSSVKIKNHEVSKKINEYKKAKPFASINDIISNCIPEEDTNKNYTAISPRNIEASLLGTLQILIPGKYSGFLKEGTDYIGFVPENPIKIINSINNKEISHMVVDNCRRKILGLAEISSDNHLASNIEFIEKNTRVKRVEGKLKFLALEKRHSRYIRNYHLMRKIKSKIKSLFLHS